MARKKKAPTTKVVSISLTTEDKAALGVQLANVIAQVESLRTQKSEESARFQKLIDEQLDIAAALGVQLRSGTQDRDQASLKIGETGELEVPEEPFADKCAHCGVDPKGQKYCSAACDRCDEKSEKGKACAGICGQRLLAGTANAIDVEAVPVPPNPEAPTVEEVTKHFGLKPAVPPAVADAIAKNGGEVDLSAAAAKNGKSRKKAEPKPEAKGKVQPPKAPAQNAVTVLARPTSCPDCGGKIVEVDKSGVYGCADSEGLGCNWLAVVESAEATSALGGMTA